MVELLDIREAARVLGVGSARVRQLIDQGELKAHRLGRYWVVDPDSVRQRASVNVTHGRPYAPRQVWRMGAMADLAVGNDEGMDILRKSIRPQERWQLRQYLAGLARERNPNQVAWRLRCRSDDVLDRYAHPSVLEKLAADPRLVLSGAHAAVLHGSDLVPDDFVDAYVDSTDVDEVVADYKLIDADDGANLRLGPVGEPLDWWASVCEASEGARVAPLLLVVADLSERDDARAKLAADKLWAGLRRRLAELTA